MSVYQSFSCIADKTHLFNSVELMKTNCCYWWLILVCYSRDPASAINGYYEDTLNPISWADHLIELEASHTDYTFSSAESSDPRLRIHIQKKEEKPLFIGPIAVQAEKDKWQSYWTVGNNGVGRRQCGDQVRTRHIDPKHVMDTVCTPGGAKHCLFINALMNSRTCYGLAAATGNTSIEETGVPYSLAKRGPIDANYPHYFRDWRGGSVNPEGIIRFALGNTMTPVAVIGCEMEKLIGYTDSTPSLLHDVIRLEVLDEDALVRTGGKELCIDCFPIEEPGTFVTRCGSALYCQEHAINWHRRGTPLLLYRPLLVSMKANRRRVWLSTLNESLVWTPLSYMDCNPGNVTDCHNDGELFIRVARNSGMKWFGGSYLAPSLIVGAMQYICQRLFKNRRLCSPSEDMGPQLKRRVTNTPGDPRRSQRRFQIYNNKYSRPSDRHQNQRLHSR